MESRFIYLVIQIAVVAAGVPTIQLAHTTNGTVEIPRMLLGTGGGNGGFDAMAWLNAGGTGFDTAQTYCYFTTPRRPGV